VEDRASSRFGVAAIAAAHSNNAIEHTIVPSPIQANANIALN
jgi:hypothetical protein